MYLTFNIYDSVVKGLHVHVQECLLFYMYMYHSKTCLVAPKSNFLVKMLPGLFFVYCVVPENIHTPPTEGIFHMTPLPLWIFQKWPKNYTPPPLWKFQFFFLHPLEIFLFLV